MRALCFEQSTFPKGYLEIDANNPVADQSACTAIVANRIELKKAPRLILHTNYSGTDVPVPQGLGPTEEVRLVDRRAPSSARHSRPTDRRCWC